MVSFPIDSQDGLEFTVKVTFTCSVADPVAVVRYGQVNAADALLAYLRAYQDLFSLGLVHPVAEINQVRADMTIQVKAYMAMRPPKIPGMQITLAAVQVETPALRVGIGKRVGEQFIEMKKQHEEALLGGQVFICYGRICYGREDAGYPAGWLFDQLTARLGADRVFKDVESIEPGEDFAEVITGAVQSCAVLLTVIGDRWLTAAGQDGRRLDDPLDFVRLEIEAALARDVRVIPVLVGGARMPRPDQLPASLGTLARRQAVELSHARFSSDLAPLLNVLDKVLS